MLIHIMVPAEISVKLHYTYMQEIVQLMLGNIFADVLRIKSWHYWIDIRLANKKYKVILKMHFKVWIKCNTIHFSMVEMSLWVWKNTLKIEV